MLRKINFQAIRKSTLRVNTKTRPQSPSFFLDPATSVASTENVVFLVSDRLMPVSLNRSSFSPYFILHPNVLDTSGISVQEQTQLPKREATSLFQFATKFLESVTQLFLNVSDRGY